MARQQSNYSMDPTGNIYNINRFPQIPTERREVQDAEAAR